MEERITFTRKDVPVVRQAEVLVVGGGYAGFGAALAAARNGAKTLLVEQQSALGGLVTMGYVALTFSYIEGIGYELFHILQQTGAVKGRFVDPEKTKVILEQMLLKEGVELLYNTTVIDSIVENDTITGVVICNKGGIQAIRAARVIDASGDGDVAAAAGVPYEVGNPEMDGYNQATSLVMHVGNVDMEEYKKIPRMSTCWLKQIEEAVASGEYPYMIDKRVNWVVQTPGRDPRQRTGRNGAESFRHVEGMGFCNPEKTESPQLFPCMGTGNLQPLFPETETLARGIPENSSSICHDAGESPPFPSDFQNVSSASPGCGKGRLPRLYQASGRHL